VLALVTSEAQVAAAPPVVSAEVNRDILHNDVEISFPHCAEPIRTLIGSISMFGGKRRNSRRDRRRVRWDIDIVVRPPEPYFRVVSWLLIECIFNHRNNSDQLGRHRRDTAVPDVGAVISPRDRSTMVSSRGWQVEVRADCHHVIKRVPADDK